MSIYDKNGNQIISAYSADGVTLQRAYDIEGNVVFTAEHNYDNPTITNIGGSVAASNTQGIDVYDNTLAVWNGSTGVRLYNVNTLASIASITTSVSSHGNDLSFSGEFYADDDDFPLLYIVSGQCLRLTNNEATFIRTVNTRSIYGMKIADAFNENTLITIGYSENRYTYTDTNKLIIAEWDMTDLTDNGDDTYTPRLIRTVTRNWLECIQGASYHDGYLWVASGLGNTGNEGHIYALDITTGAIVVNINTGDTHEIEGMAWAYNSTDGWYIIFGQVGTGFRKITFS